MNLISSMLNIKQFQIVRFSKTAKGLTFILSETSDHHVKVIDNCFGCCQSQEFHATKQEMHTQLVTSSLVSLLLCCPLPIYLFITSLPRSLLSSHACFLDPDGPPAWRRGGVHLPICIQHLSHQHLCDHTLLLAVPIELLWTAVCFFKWFWCQDTSKTDLWASKHAQTFAFGILMILQII